MRPISHRSSLAAALVLAGLGLAAHPASAQIAGTTQRPLPNVLLLVDTSGSMERMIDGSMPGDTPASECKAGDTRTNGASTPNKWGMLVQALTGNLQPYYSCERYPRTANSRFQREFQIALQPPYDVDYSLPYHRPVSNGGDQCVLVPYKVPGAGPGVGPGQLRSGTGNATDYPDDALASVFNSYATASANGAGMSSTSIPLSSQCVFAQTPDGQLDAARDYARFALMTFDSDVAGQTGLAGSATLPAATNQLVSVDPFKGQWSFRRHSGNYFWNGANCSTSGQACERDGVGAMGAPLTPGCITEPFEVGARNEAAPPWEGRLIPFPPPLASLAELERSNEQIQRTLIATRPYGATPIDAMFDDARDYLQNYTGGPGAPSGDTRDFQCRDNFVVLLTDGAPNLNLRPSCMGTGANRDNPDGEGGVCPYPKSAALLAHQMLMEPTGAQPKVTTFVIGFAVAGENGGGTGFPASQPASDRNCKAWFDSPTGGQGSAQTMQAVCAAPSTKPAAGTTAEACCKLNDIAYNGSNDGVSPPVGAFFAESQADIVFAFGRIMANIVRAASTRTIPAYTPAALFSNTSLTGSNVTTSARFMASFIPNSQAPWSGELDRTRYQCKNTPPKSVPDPTSSAQGDLMSVNLAAQTVARERLVFTVVGDAVGSNSVVDSAATLRPYANVLTGNVTSIDDVKAPDASGPRYGGVEVAMKDDLNFDTTGGRLTKALNIDANTCQRSRRPSPNGFGTDIVPALSADDCRDVVWGFATAWPRTLNYSGYNRFNVRCDAQAAAGGGSSESGKCSIRGNNCTVGGTGCAAGETCVPECSALGAILHANPVVVGPPNELLREEGFRTYQTVRRGRLPITYVATTDGLLHAFKATATGTAAGKHELWSFVPPAVLPRLASNYPQGNQTLLDGTPVVAESIWERRGTDTTGALAPAQWHTTLVAGLGGTGGGYYALNVTDADCSNGSGPPGDPNTVNCTSTFAPAGAGGTLAEVSNGGVIAGTIKRGPHFLWQLTDIPAESGETAKIARSSNVVVASRRQNMMALFGKHPGTPAVAMVQISDGSREDQVGVAILPGGYDDPVQPTGSCARGGAPSMTDPAFPGSAPVRKWGTDCDGPIPGRGVTIVRLDNGEIIRHFGRIRDTPKAVQSRLTPTAFDSPMTGTPVVYPSGAGVPAQKVFIGDADGTLWRIDLTSNDPRRWSAALFADLQSPTLGVTVANRQPIQVPPVISTNSRGNLVINVATGDQDSIVQNNDERDVLFSITEGRNSSNGVQAQVNWYQRFQASERVTGPMAVFDRSLYYATYRPYAPPNTGLSCGLPGIATLWGQEFETPAVGPAGTGGLPRWCPLNSVSDVTGLCNVALQPFELMTPAVDPEGALIPGVSMSATSSCTGAPVNDETGGMAYSSVTPVQYTLNFGASKISNNGSSTPQAARMSSMRQLPRNSTKIDSWSIVIE